MSRLEEIKERCEKATPGPWEQVFQEMGDYTYIKPVNWTASDNDKRGIIAIVDRSELNPTPYHPSRFGDQQDLNREFIAHSREDIPWLVSQLEKAIEVAEYYGSLARWSYKSPDNEIQQGKKAREFLEQIKERA